MLTSNAIFAARTGNEFRDELIRFTHELGFPTCDVTAFIRRGNTSDEDHIYIDNLPRSDEWKHLDPGLGKRCPVMQHCKTSSLPTVWDESTYRKHNCLDIFDAISALGLRSGASVSLHLPSICFQVSVHSDLPLESKALGRTLSKLTSFASAALVPAEALFFAASSGFDVQSLTRIEREALAWISDGMTVEQVARKLSMSITDTEQMLGLAAKTLGCSSSQGASLKAMRLGII
ncbi:autoinducer binding domain-containing protein [Paucibacter sp. APW11]|uniref:Autoinducer binding domain-containing protein n=1 Tax=Roseateles aquae TaxID=3077235 RepID=A0ABU3P9F8_9BURK|nr:autoinducer binding domain-containing protein [Paucibacter sp. APW11]MDT8998366.1 autoinducer binding domain-containing protein [Paucibacter sp. APW11]